MAFTRGGRADKFGNHYESLWVASRLLDLISEVTVRSITVESIGELEEGVDLWVEGFDGVCVAEQCKARNGSKENWTVGDLKSVITKIPVHIKNENQKSFKLVTPLTFTLLQDLCEDARNSDDSEGYFSGIVSKSKNKKLVIKSFFKALSLNDEAREDRELAYLYLKQFYIECFQGAEGTVEDLKLKASYMLTGKPNTSISLLRNYIIDKKMLGKSVTAKSILKYLADNEIYQRKIIGDQRLTTALNALNDDFNNSISNLLINGQLIKREETKKCFELLEDNDVVILHGDAGKGKSSVLFELIQSLYEMNTPCLAIKLDRKLPKGSSRLFGEQLGLPDSPALCLAKYSGKNRAVLVLDQLDAIRWTSENSLEGIDICKQMITEASTHNFLEEGHLKVIIVCRSFDLENDPEIKNWLLNRNMQKQFAKVEIKELGKEEIKSSVGSSYNSLTEAQIKILGIPQNLYMWLEIKDEEGLSFTNTADLMRAFWRSKRLKIENNGVNVDHLDSALESVVSYLELNGTISAPNRILEKLSTNAVTALMSNSILQQQGSRVMFCHQSYLDYLIADKVFAEIERGGTVLNWLGGKNEQTLYRRQQLSLFLFLIKRESESNFVDIAREILFSNNIRFHIKHLVFEVLSQYKDINNESGGLIDELLSDKELKNHVLKVSMFGNPALVNHFIESGVIKKWIESDIEEDIQNVLWILSSVISSIPDTVGRVLREAHKDKKLSKDQIYRCLNFKISEDTEELFNLRLKLIEEGAVVNFVHWKELASNNSPHAFRLIKLLSNIETTGENLGRIGDRKLYDHDLNPLMDAVDSCSELVWDLFHRESINKLREYEADECRSRYNSFDIEKTYSNRRSYIENFTDLGILLSIKAGKVLAGSVSDDFVNMAEESGAKFPDNLLGIIFLSLTPSYSDYVITWLLEDPKRLSLGLDFQRPKWMLASDLIKRFSKNCNDKLFSEMENYLYTYTPSGEDFKRAYEYRVTSAKKGFFFPAWGEAQYFLVPSLSEKRTSRKTKEFIQVLRRKFGKCPQSKFFSGYTGKGGWVGSKLEPNLYKISDKSWFNIITNKKVSKKHECTSSVQVNEDTIHVSSHDTFSDSLERVAKMNPKRFANLFNKLSEGIDNSYISSMLRALSLTEPEKGKTEDNSTRDWKKAEVEDVVSFWKKYRDKRFENNIARSFCWLISKRSKEKWPQFMVEDLFELALIHENPKFSELTSYTEGETYEAASVSSLHSTTINSVRGSAIESIGCLLWEHKELISLVEENIDQILSDKHPSVMMAVQSIALPTLNIDKEKAIDWFTRACGKDVKVACTHEAVNFFNYMMHRKDNRLISIVSRMANSDIDEVLELSSEMITFYSHCYDGIFEKELSEVTIGGLPQKKGVVKALKNLIRKDRHALNARELFKNYFNDSEKKIRKDVSFFFNDKDVLNISENIELAMMYIESQAFSEDEAQIFRCLSEYEGSLVKFSSLILKACEQMLTNIHNKSGDHARRYEQKNIVSLLLRLYDQSGSDSYLRENCLDIWDMFFKENVDMIRDITKVISK